MPYPQNQSRNSLTSSILGMDLALTGRQVQTGFGGRIDLLALDADANCVIVEPKGGRTPRDVVAQILEYAAWIRGLGYGESGKIAEGYRKKISPPFTRRVLGRRSESR